TGEHPSDTNTTMGLQFAGIDTLNLSVGKVKYSSLRKPGKSTELEIGLKNEVLTNVKSMEDLSGLLLKVIFRKGFNILTGGPSAGIDLFPGIVLPPGTNSAKGPPPANAPSRRSPWPQKSKE